MPGTKAGAAKTRAKLLGKDPDYFKKIGGKSWQNQNRSRKTGFALLDEEKHKELSRKGGQKTKEEYQTTAADDTETEGGSPGQG